MDNLGAKSIDNLKKVIIFLCKAFYAILSVCPFLIGSIYACVNLTGGWERFSQAHDKAFYRMPEFDNVLASLMIVLIILGTAAWIYKAISTLCKRINNRKMRSAVIVSILFSVTVILRLVPELVYSGQIHPFSDFAHAWARANGDMSSAEYYRFFASYMNYSLFLKVISKLCSGNYTAVILFDIICNGITAVFIFLIAKEISAKENSAVIASLLFAFNPSSIVYALTSSPEHMAIASYGCCVYLLCKMFRERNNRKILIYAVCSGIAGGIGNSVKTFFPVIMVAAVIVLLLKNFYELNNLQHIMKKIFIYILSFMLVIVSASAVLTSITSLTERIFAVQLDFADATPHYINVGLNRQGEGQIGIGNLSRLYIQDRQNGIKLEEASDAAIKRIKDDWVGNEAEIPAFIIKKTIWAWQDDYVPIRYFCQRLGIEPSTLVEKAIYFFAENYLNTISQLWYILMMLAGALCSVKRIKLPVDSNWLLMLNSLLIVGFFCMMMISEAQSRYKCLILPYICIFIACVYSDNRNNKTFVISV